MNLRDLSDEELQSMLATAKAKAAGANYKPINATDEMPWWQQGLAGMGKAFKDTGRGLGQLLPGDVVSRKDMDEAKHYDASLMDTGWGLAGNIAGNVIPALALPASTLPRALAVGAGLGFAQPVGTNDSRIENTLMGGGAAGLVPAAGALWRGGKAIAEPVLAPQRTAARLLEQFADDPQAMRLAAANARELVPGSKPTLAQAVQQPGISSLERGALNQPGPLQKSMADRAMEQNAARVRVMDELAGKDGALDFHKASRSTAAEGLYAKAFAEMPEDSAWIAGEVTKLMQRPAFTSALKDGQELALNLGIKVNPKNPENTTQILHFAKQALDDKIEAAVRAGNGNSSRALIDTRDKLVSLMESKGFSPSYREARDTFRQMSQPINEMEIAGDLSKKLVPALSDVAQVQAPTRLLADNFAGEVRRRAPDIAKSFSPEGKGKLDSLVQDLQRKSSAESLGKANGSPTAQYLTTQNLMRQIAGPLGMPQGFMEKAGSAAMATPVLGSALQWAGKGAESRVQRELADLLLDPSQASAAFARINRQPNAMQRKLAHAHPYLPALSASGLFAYGGQ